MLCWLPLILLSLPSSLCQFFNGGMRPDMVFGEHNDRYDISPLLREPKRLRSKDYSEESRRSADSSHRVPVNNGRRANVNKKQVVDKYFIDGIDDQANTDPRKGIFDDSQLVGISQIRREKKNLRRALREIQSDSNIGSRRISSGMAADDPSLPDLHKNRRRPQGEEHEQEGRIYNRRAMDGDINRVLFEHAVPVKFNLNGYIQLK